jgi:hypothetical protein
VTTLNSEEVELVEETSKNWLDIFGISSMKKKGKGTSSLQNGCQLFASSVGLSIYAHAGVAITVGLNPMDAVPQ